MGRTRSNIIIDRPPVDEYGLDSITTKVRTISVYQGIIEGHHEFAVVQKSGRSSRKPFEVNEFAHLIRSLRHFEPTIFAAPEGCAYCSNCGEWRKNDRFSPNKYNSNGLQSWCKQCRNDQARRMYWAGREDKLLAA